MRVNLVNGVGAVVLDGRAGNDSITTLQSIKTLGIKDSGGNQVLTSRQAAVVDATNSTDVITQFNLWLARARTHGFIW